jgi:chorismate mutase/prephenate dehydratase
LHFAVTAVAVQGIRTVFAAVESGTATHGVIPVENATSGTLPGVFDALLGSSLFIVGECSFRENHCLCALPGTQQADIRQVFSHHHILTQCEGFLDKLQRDQGNGDAIHRMGVWDSAASCQMLVERQIRDGAAIASQEAAILNGLQILLEPIGNDANNETRYLILSKNAEKSLSSHVRNKSSVAVVLRNEPMSIFKIISCNTNRFM